jgi:hypothetical protein
MKILTQEQIDPTFELYNLIIDKCYRMNFLKEPLTASDIINVKASPNLPSLIEQLDNATVQAILPALEKILDKGLYDMYQVLYTIDVPEEMIKDKIMDLENTSMIPSIIAFAIIDRLKRRYKQYPLLKEKSYNTKS